MNHDPSTLGLCGMASTSFRPRGRRRSSRCAVCLAVLAAATACQDFPIVELPEEAPPPIEVTLERTIGGVEGPPEELFDRILSLVGFEDGGFWVLDGGVFGSDPRIRRYSAQGRYLGEVGRRGEGPGEFMSPYAMTAIGDGRVIIRDQANAHRLSVYFRDGTWEQDWVFSQPLYGRPGFAQPLVRDVDGVLWIRIITSRPGPQRSEDGRMVYVRIGPDGEISDTVASPLPPPTESVKMVDVDKGGATRVPMAVPFQPRGVLALTPLGRFARGVTSEYALELAEPVRWEPGSVPDRLRTTGWISGPTQRIPVTDAEQRAWIDWVSGRNSEQDIRDLPSSKPPMGAVYFDENGRVWIRAAVPSVHLTTTVDTEDAVAERAWAGDIQEPQAFDIFDLRGELLGRVALPSGSCRGQSQTFRSQGDHLWCVHWNESRIESVRRYRITWP
jgi:hypothetical protein